ncbi:unnamed protein product [Pedinophyceae sp. YPF-701]|nr:unnamed protein product [Pedinophyceae sp. YPF-701]
MEVQRLRRREGPADATIRAAKFLRNLFIFLALALLFLAGLLVYLARAHKTAFHRVKASLSDDDAAPAQLGPSFVGQEGGDAVPLVVWHGMGDSCCDPQSLGKFLPWLQQQIPGRPFIHSIQLGDSEAADRMAGFYGNVNAQVAAACQQLAGVPELAGGFYALGFSQGAQFLRALAQRCPHPRMRRLVSLGGQHAGVASAPRCGTPADEDESAACGAMRGMLRRGAYWPWVRDHIVQAQYFRDPGELGVYLKNNPFLPDVNNEGEEKKAEYAERLSQLEALVLVLFAADHMVVPRESSLFGELQEDGTVVPLRETRMYREDWLGLRALDEAGRLVELTTPGDHLQFEKEWFLANVLPYLTGGGAEG